ncbi:MAG TPA: IspD/TarI family cytidylyltransferase [Nocardioidaceae bacterium]|nr:IspD/TarI family cytidylyltransferase [Nocardioidaceae bacterium]
MTPRPGRSSRAPGSERTRAALVVLAAGEGSRVGHDTNKVLLPLAGRRVFTWSIRWAHSLPQVTSVVLVIREADRDHVVRALDRELPEVDVRVVVGGSSRHESEWKALQALAPDIRSGDTDVVVIHDAARPLAGARVFLDVIDAADRHGGALPVRDQPALTTLEESAGTVRLRTVAVQTPQAFRALPLLEAYTRASTDAFVGTDTASCVERYTDVAVRCVPGDAGNIKITFPEDLFLAERLLAKADWDLSSLATRPTPAREARRRRGG